MNTEQTSKINFTNIKLHLGTRTKLDDTEVELTLTTLKPLHSTWIIDMMYTMFFFSKSRTMQDNKGHFGGFCRAILTLNEG